MIRVIVRGGYITTSKPRASGDDPAAIFAHISLDA